jgi:hypothetical protein
VVFGLIVLAALGIDRVIQTRRRRASTASEVAA